MRLTPSARPLPSRPSSVCLFAHLCVCVCACALSLSLSLSSDKLGQVYTQYFITLFTIGSSLCSKLKKERKKREAIFMSCRLICCLAKPNEAYSARAASTVVEPTLTTVSRETRSLVTVHSLSPETNSPQQPLSAAKNSSFPILHPPPNPPSFQLLLRAFTLYLFPCICL